MHYNFRRAFLKHNRCTHSHARIIMYYPFNFFLTCRPESCRHFIKTLKHTYVYAYVCKTQFTQTVNGAITIYIDRDSFCSEIRFMFKQAMIFAPWRVVFVLFTVWDGKYFFQIGNAAENKLDIKLNILHHNI